MGIAIPNAPARLIANQAISQPPFPVEARMTRSMVTGLSDSSPAGRKATVDGGGHQNRRLIIKFAHAAAGSKFLDVDCWWLERFKKQPIHCRRAADAVMCWVRT